MFGQQSQFMDMNADFLSLKFELWQRVCSADLVWLSSGRSYMSNEIVTATCFKQWLIKYPNQLLEFSDMNVLLWRIAYVIIIYSL